MNTKSVLFLVILGFSGFSPVFGEWSKITRQKRAPLFSNYRMLMALMEDYGLKPSMENQAMENQASQWNIYQ